MSTDDETTMIRETVAKFVDRELIPLEPAYSEVQGCPGPASRLSDAQERLRTVSKDLGLWGLDAPEDLGGHDLPTRHHGRGPRGTRPHLRATFMLPPDSPNLRMLQAVGTEAQKRKYMQPYIEGRMVSAIAISEPGAGGDPAAMKTRAVLEGDQWVLNGRKIWITNAQPR